MKKRLFLCMVMLGGTIWTMDEEKEEGFRFEGQSTRGFFSRDKKPELQKLLDGVREHQQEGGAQIAEILEGVLNLTESLLNHRKAYNEDADEIIKSLGEVKSDVRGIRDALIAQTRDFAEHKTETSQIKQDVDRLIQALLINQGPRDRSQRAHAEVEQLPEGIKIILTKKQLLSLGGAAVTALVGYLMKYYFGS